MASARSSGLDAEERAASAHDTARRYVSAMQLPRNTIVLLMCRFRWMAQSRVESPSRRATRRPAECPKGLVGPYQRHCTAAVNSAGYR